MSKRSKPRNVIPTHLDMHSSLDEKMIEELTKWIPVVLLKLNSNNGWTDKTMVDLASKVKFPEETFNPGNYKIIINRFFNFYFTGNIPEEVGGYMSLDPNNPRGPRSSQIINILSSAASLLNVFDGKTFKRAFDTEYKGESFFNLNHLPECEPLHRVSIQCQFKREIEAILQTWNESNVWDEKQAKLMRLTAFLALTLFRSIGENQQQLMDTFKSNDYRVILADHVQWGLNQPFSPPSKECLEECEIQVNHSILHPILKIVVHRYVASIELQPEDQNKIGSLLQLSLLDSLKFHKMDVIKMLFSVLDYTGKTPQQLFKEIHPLSIDDVYWKPVLKFLEEYLLQPNKVPYSLPWARLIDDDYFQRYSLEDYKVVAATFSAMLGKAGWYKHSKINSEYLLNGKLLGSLQRITKKFFKTPLVYKPFKLKHKNL